MILIVLPANVVDGFLDLQAKAKLDQHLVEKTAVCCTLVVK